MKYTIYFKGSLCNVLDDESRDFILNMVKDGHKKPKDTTEITISYDESDNTIFYRFDNLSEDAYYLFNELDELGIALIVKDTIGYIGNTSTEIKSKTSKRNHPNTHISNHQGVRKVENSGEGRFEFNTQDGAPPVMSHQLNYILSSASNYEDPYREDGYEDVAICIGRYTPNVDSFRPFKVSNFIRLYNIHY